MIGNDRFVQVFGSVPAGDDSKLVQIVANAVREGFHVVLCAPGTNQPVCTLPATKAKLEHDCGAAHVLSLESVLGEPEPWSGSQIDPTEYAPQQLAKVRAKVQAVINRVTKAHDGVKPNIGVVPGPSGYVVAVVNSSAGFLRFAEHFATEAEVPGITVPIAQGAEHAGWFWFQLPTGFQLPEFGYADSTHEDWALTWGWPMPVPPAKLGWLPSEIIGQTSPAPAWLMERIAQS